MDKCYLGIDIGGTAVKLGLVDGTGHVLVRDEQSVSFDGYKAGRSRMPAGLRGASKNVEK